MALLIAIFIIALIIRSYLFKWEKSMNSESYTEI